MQTVVLSHGPFQLHVDCLYSAALYFMQVIISLNCNYKSKDDANHPYLCKEYKHMEMQILSKRLLVFLTLSRNNVSAERGLD